jgi:hypothetical protein
MFTLLYIFYIHHPPRSDAESRASRKNLDTKVGEKSGRVEIRDSGKSKKNMASIREELQKEIDFARRLELVNDLLAEERCDAGRAKEITDQYLTPYTPKPANIWGNYPECNCGERCIEERDMRQALYDDEFDEFFNLVEKCKIEGDLDAFLTRSVPYPIFFRMSLFHIRYTPIAYAAMRCYPEVCQRLVDLYKERGLLDMNSALFKFVYDCKFSHPHNLAMFLEEGFFKNMDQFMESDDFNYFKHFYPYFRDDPHYSYFNSMRRRRMSLRLLCYETLILSRREGDIERIPKVTLDIIRVDRRKSIDEATTFQYTVPLISF